MKTLYFAFLLVAFLPGSANCQPPSFLPSNAVEVMMVEKNTVLAIPFMATPAELDGNSATREWLVRDNAGWWRGMGWRGGFTIPCIGEAFWPYPVGGTEGFYGALLQPLPSVPTSFFIFQNSSYYGEVHPKDPCKMVVTQ